MRKQKNTHCTLLTKLLIILFILAIGHASLNLTNPENSIGITVNSGTVEVNEAFAVSSIPEHADAYRFNSEDHSNDFYKNTLKSEPIQESSIGETEPDQIAVFSEYSAEGTFNKFLIANYIIAAPTSFPIEEADAVTSDANKVSDTPVYSSKENTNTRQTKTASSNPDSNNEIESQSTSDKPEPIAESASSATASQTTSNSEKEETPVATAAPVQQTARADRIIKNNNLLLRNLRVQIVVTNNGDAVSNNIRLEIPLLANLDSPYQTLLEEIFSHQPAEILARAMRSRSKLVVIPTLQPGTSETITIDYAIQALDMASAAVDSSTDSSEFLLPSAKIESDHPEIVSALSLIEPKGATPYDKAKAIYSFVIDYLTYNLNAPNRNQGALSALQNKTGVCEDYSSLFVALARASGIPARIVKGYADPRLTGQIWNLSAGQTLPLNRYRHAWVEFFIEGKGWLPADPTFERSPDSFEFFGRLPVGSHIAQNYFDLSLRARSSGGRLSVRWNEKLVTN